MQLADYDTTHKGATWHGYDLEGMVLDDCLLPGARFKNVDLRGAKIRGSLLIDVEITGEVDNLTVNGVDVSAFVEAELERRDPDRAKMRPTDPAGFREAWDILERRWAETVERARRLDPELLHERVDGEWSFIETLRHLVFATDAWIRRALLGDPSPWSPLDLPHEDMGERPGVPNDTQACPSLEEVLELRRDRRAACRADHRGRGARLPQLRGVPRRGRGLHDPQRGVDAPAVRRARPGRPRGRSRSWSRRIRPVEESRRADARRATSARRDSSTTNRSRGTGPFARGPATRHTGYVTARRGGP